MRSCVRRNCRRMKSVTEPRRTCLRTSVSSSDSRGASSAGARRESFKERALTERTSTSTCNREPAACEAP
jgi:hypothetical protein